jgi:hypothetical protein
VTEVKYYHNIYVYIVLFFKNIFHIYGYTPNSILEKEGIGDGTNIRDYIPARGRITLGIGIEGLKII